MNQLKIWGASASPIVKAVLDNIGRRYLVEHWESEDGLQEYDLYSDGRLVQGGLLKYGELTLPKPYRDINFTITCSVKSGTDDWEWARLIGVRAISPSTITGGSIHISEFTFVCQGYAA